MEEKEVQKIKISPQTLQILQRLFVNVEEKKKQYEEADKALKDAILISMTTNGIGEINFYDWRTNLNEGYHVKRSSLDK